MALETTPIKLDLKRDEKLEIEWQDGLKSTYPIQMLRSMCPCARCKQVREGNDPHSLMQPAKKSLLTILPGDYSKPLTVLDAEFVGGYALRLEWSDNHGSGIYSFQYLREISPQKK